MNRLQKKCFIVSASLHLLLALILLVGPAFLSPQRPPDDSPILDFIPVVTTDAKMSGGGEHNAHSAPPAAPSQPAPPSQHETPPVRHTDPAPDPDPPKSEPKETRRDTESVEVSHEHKRHKIEVSTTPVVRRPDASSEARARAQKEARERARAQAEANQRLARAFEQAGTAVGNGVSSGIDVKLSGPGGGGVPYANFNDAVRTIYTEAWIVPDGVTDDSATVGASVTIARDGTVLASRITRSSGNPAVDASVRATLKRVTRVVPLPAGATEDQRSINLNFNVRAKRLFG